MNQVFICEKVKEAITCPSGFTVNILSASYGRTPRAVCKHRKHGKMSNTNYDSTEDITGILQRHCASPGGSSCKGKPTNALFKGDPCAGTYKYLTENYNCGELNESSLYMVTSIFYVRPSQAKRCLRTYAKCTKYHPGLCSPFMHPVVSNDSMNGQ